MPASRTSRHPTPAAQYRFDEASGSTATDSSGNGFHAAYVNQPQLGQPGTQSGNTAVALDGLNQYVALQAGPLGNPTAADYTLTFETWYKASPDASGVILGQSGAGTLPGSGTPAGYVPAVHLGIDGRLRSSLFWHGSTAARIVSPAAYNDGRWHHVAVTYAGGVETLYLDGVAVGQQAAANVAYAGSYEYFLGTGFTSSWEGGNGGWHFFRGQLDEAAFHSRPLSPAEIAERFNAGKPDPLAAIRAVSGLTSEDSSGLLVLVNFHRFLQSAEIVQALVRQLNEGKQSRTFVLILAPVVQIPVELEKLLVIVEHPLPGRQQLEEIARGVATNKDELPSGIELQRLLDAAVGLTRYEAENAFSLSLTRHGRLQVETLWELKSQALKKSGLLTLHRGSERFYDLGGLEASASGPCGGQRRLTATCGRAASCCFRRQAAARASSPSHSATKRSGRRWSWISAA